jgi:hypothetical protein
MVIYIRESIGLSMSMKLGLGSMSGILGLRRRMDMDELAPDRCPVEPACLSDRLTF